MSIFRKTLLKCDAIEFKNARLEKTRAEAREHAKGAFKVAMIDARGTISLEEPGLVSWFELSMYFSKESLAC